MSGAIFITLGQGAELGIEERYGNEFLFLRQPHPEHSHVMVETNLGLATTKRMDDLIKCIERLKAHAIDIP